MIGNWGLDFVLAWIERILARLSWFHRERIGLGVESTRFRRL